jgi:hypothetical protein
MDTLLIADGAVGTFQISSFEQRFDQLTVINVVPVPAAAWLFISALGGLVVAKRKQLKA